MNYGVVRFGLLLTMLNGVTAAHAGGVTPYLPLNLSPEIERKVNKVMILGGQALTRKPIPAARVLDALPAACEYDRQLCEEVRQYLQRYMRTAGITHAYLEMAASSGNEDKVIPNQHGLTVGSPVSASATAFYQPSDYLLLSAGGVLNEEHSAPTNTLISAGVDFAQLDVGYRDHWLSPMSDSSALISTEAPTMPSVTLSNYQPITRLGLGYELFLARMSWSDNIVYQDTTTAGYPRLAGIHLSAAPWDGFEVSLNRTLQFGGGARNDNRLSALFNAFVNPTTYDQTDRLGNKQEFGNQLASITGSLLFPGKTPFAVHFEYAGEDTGYASYMIGRNILTLGLDVPKLWRQLDLGIEASEWQDSWYIHHLYLDGYRYDDLIPGHWFANNRVLDTDAWGHSTMVRLGWQRESGDYWRIIYRDMTNKTLSASQTRPTLREVGVRYATLRKGHQVAAELYAGRDVFGEHYARLSASLELARSSRAAVHWPVSQAEYDGTTTDFLVDLGVTNHRVIAILGSQVPHENYPDDVQPHVGLGVRRKVSEHSDLGVRLDIDRAQDHSLISLRALDYRYRFGRKLAVNGFFGVSRYEVQLPMYGYYFGAGLQWMNVLPRWDLGVEWRNSQKVMRARVLPSDPYQGDIPNIYYSISSIGTKLSYHF